MPLAWVNEGSPCKCGAPRKVWGKLHPESPEGAPVGGWECPNGHMDYIWSNELVLYDVAALYVDVENGPYAKIDGVDCWGIERDATKYDGPYPIIAHPPCGHWGTFAWNCKRPIEEKWCGPRAFEQVRKWGGIIEHPYKTALFDYCDAPKPGDPPDKWGGITVAMDQVWYGHAARKRTLLYIVGAKPDFSDADKEAQPTRAMGVPRSKGRTLLCLPKSRRHITPMRFARWLVALARKVDMKKKTISPSSFKTFKACNRAWFFYKVWGIKSPATRSQALGTKVHDLLEKYLDGSISLKDVEDSPQGRIAIAGLPNLPKPSKKLHIEEDINEPCGPRTLVGRVDFWQSKGKKLKISDHKTTSDLKWALSPEQLAKDPQVLAYAYALRKKTGATKIKAEHIYYTTRGMPLSRLVSTKLSEKDIEANFKAMAKAAKAMDDLEGLDDQDEVPYNLNHCGAYGGCFYRSMCTAANPDKKRARTMAKKNRALLDKAKLREGLNPPDASPEGKTPGLIADMAKKAKKLVKKMNGKAPYQMIEVMILKAGGKADWTPEVLKAAKCKRDGDFVVKGKGKTEAPEASKPSKTTEAIESEVTSYDFAAISDPKDRACAEAMAEAIHSAGRPLSLDECAAAIKEAGAMSRVRQTRVESAVDACAVLEWTDGDKEGVRLAGTIAAPTEEEEETEEEETEEETTEEEEGDPALTKRKKDKGKKDRGPDIQATISGAIVYVNAYPEGMAAQCVRLDDWLRDAGYFKRAEVKTKSAYWLTADFNEAAKQIAGMVRADGMGAMPMAILCDASHPVTTVLLPVFREFGCFIVRGVA